MREPNKDHIRLWVDGLRTWPHPQGHTYLTQYAADGTRLDCCLGVACQVAIDNGLPLEAVRHPTASDGRQFEFVRYNSDGAELPLEVSAWLGQGSNPVLGRNGSEYEINCIEANDTLEWSFEQIADALEAEYLS